METDAIKEAFPDFEGDWEHLQVLLQGVEHWNKWREQDPDVEPNLFKLVISAREERPLGQIWELNKQRRLWRAHLENVHLEHANLGGARLEHAYLVAAHLENAHLGGSHLEHASFQGAHLEHANFFGAHLEHAGLATARLEHANLQGAHLEHAGLGGTHLEHANLQGAHLEHANLFQARLENAQLGTAHLEHADLREADLKQAELTQTDLSEADLRVEKPQHLRLNDTRIRGARFAPGSADPWSVVRTAYSGPALLFHLLFLLVFLVPYLGRAAYWKGINAAQEALQATQLAASPLLESARSTLELAESPTAHEELEMLWEEQGLDPQLLPRGREVLEEATRRQRDRVRETLRVRALEPLLEIGPCLRPAAECGPAQPIVRPLLGLHRQDDPLRLLALVLVLYNLARGVATWYVSRLRDAEVRGGYSPRLKEYIKVYYVHHWFLQFVPWAAITAALFRVAEWLLLTDVVLPAV